MTNSMNNYTGIIFNQGDLNVDILTINLTHKNKAMDISTATDVSIFFLKQDGTTNLQNLSSGVTIQNASSGVISLAFNTETLSVPRNVQAEVHVTFPGTQTIIFKRFLFMVEDSISNGSISLNSYQVLTPIQVVNSVSDLPSPSVKYQFLAYAVKGTTGVADGIYYCKKLSDGTYDWVQVV
jgi:hypothetical protein